MDESRYPQYAFLHHSFLNQTLTLLAYSHGGAVLLNSQAVRSRNQKDTLSTSQFRPAKCAFSPLLPPRYSLKCRFVLVLKTEAFRRSERGEFREKRLFSPVFLPSFALLLPSTFVRPSEFAFEFSGCPREGQEANNASSMSISTSKLEVR
jgi:hypothetical protein